MAKANRKIYSIFYFEKMCQIFGHVCGKVSEGFSVSLRCKLVQTEWINKVLWWYSTGTTFNTL